MALLITLNELFIITVLQNGTFMMYLGKFSLTGMLWELDDSGQQKAHRMVPRVMFVGL